MRGQWPFLWPLSVGGMGEGLFRDATSSSHLEAQADSKSKHWLQSSALRGLERRRLSLTGNRRPDSFLQRRNPPNHIVVKPMAKKKTRIRLRLYEHELAQLDMLAESLGCPSRTRLLNILLRRLLGLGTLSELAPCRKRTVKFLLDTDVLQNLNEAANISGMASRDIIRMAIHRFTERSGSE